jgi:hypothetical protein
MMRGGRAAQERHLAIELGKHLLEARVLALLLVLHPLLVAPHCLLVLQPPLLQMLAQTVGVQCALPLSQLLPAAPLPFGGRTLGGC